MKKLAIIGAGIIGLNLALEASYSGFDVTVFEEHKEVGRGASGHTAGVLHVLQTPFNSWKSRLALEGNPLYDKLSAELDFRILRLPALLVFRNNAEKIIAFIIAEYLKLKGFKVNLIDKTEVKDLCPDISRNIKGAIKVDGYGTVIPLEVLKAYVKKLKNENVEIRFNEKALKVKYDKHVEISTNKSSYLYDYAIIAAGGGVKGLLNNMKKLEYAKGVMVLARGIECNAIIAALFSKTRSRKTKGGGIIPWPDGRILFGPSFKETNDPWDISVTEEEADETIKNYRDLIEPSPRVEEFFAGTRVKAPPKYDFIVEKKNSIIALYGIDSPGFTAAPALAKYVLKLIR